MGFVRCNDDRCNGCSCGKKFLTLSSEFLQLLLPEFIVLTCTFHLQSPVHISLKILMFPSSSSKIFSGKCCIRSRKAGLPMSSCIHSTRFCFHRWRISQWNSPFSSFRHPWSQTVCKSIWHLVGEYLCTYRRLACSWTKVSFYYVSDGWDISLAFDLGLRRQIHIQWATSSTYL